MTKPPAPSSVINWLDWTETGMPPMPSESGNRARRQVQRTLEELQFCEAEDMEECDADSFVVQYDKFRPGVKSTPAPPPAHGKLPKSGE